MNTRTKWLACLTVILLGHAVCLSPALAETNKWIGGATGFWTNGASWSLTRAPDQSDDVLISSNVTVTVVLNTNVTVASLTLTNSGSAKWSTVTFTNWNTCLTATNIYVLGGGQLTHYLNTDTNSLDEWSGNCRVYIVCTNFTLAAGATINADAVGYAGGLTGTNGYGPGGGGSSGERGAGGGYGGKGGNGQGAASIGGVTNGSAAAPTGPGSSGGGSIYVGRGDHGGGAIWLEVSGTATVDGTITANGEGRSSSSGGGAGGGIYLRCGTFTGSGRIRANGGTAANYGGGGGGGRIAVLFDQANASNVQFSVDGGGGYLPSRYGSLYLSKYDGALPNLITNSYELSSPTNTWRPAMLTISNTLLVLPQSLNLGVTGPVSLIAGCTLEMSTNVAMSGGGSVTLSGASKLYMYPGSALSGGGNVTLSGSSKLYMYSGSVITNMGSVSVRSSSTIYPYCNSTSGVPPGGLFVGSFLVETGSTVNADYSGYAGGPLSTRGYGPGGGGYGPQRGGGGGYGGRGGKGLDAASTGGVANGVAEAPLGPGSGGGGGGSSRGGYSGGAIRIEAIRNITIDGTITANGENAGYSGGGSGGGIYLRCKTIDGIGTNRANGGIGDTANSPPYSGGGGGGRIAVYCMYSNFYGACVVAPGTGYSGGPTSQVGTIYWQILPVPGSVFSIR